MAKRSLLSAAIEREQPQANENEAVPPVVASIARAPREKAKEIHLGAYYPEDDPDVEAFNVLVARTRGKNKKALLLEAVRDLVQKYETQTKFGR